MSYANSDIRTQLAERIQAKASHEVVIVFIDISESTSHQKHVGVGSAIDRMVGLSFSLIQNLQALKSLVKFEPKNIVKSIGDELMLALPLPKDTNKRPELLVRLVEALNKTIFEEEHLSLNLRKLVPVGVPQKPEVQVYKISIGVCHQLVSGDDILNTIESFNTIVMAQKFRRRIFRPEDFWGTDVNQTARITGLSGNKVILLNGKAQELILAYKGTKSFSCTDLYSFAAKGLGEMSVSQVIQEADDDFPHILKKYGYCCLLFIDIQNFEDKGVSEEKKIKQKLVNVMEKNFSAPTLAFGYQLKRKIAGDFKETQLDFVFAVMSQDFEKYQSKVGDVIKSMYDPPNNINYTISYPLWEPFKDETSHPFFQYAMATGVTIEAPDHAIISMASFGSTENALIFRDNVKVEPDKLWNVFGDVDVIGIHGWPDNPEQFTEGFRKEMEDVAPKRRDEKYRMFWEAVRVYPPATAV